MNMESNFDDTMFEVDEFDETPTPEKQEPDQKPENIALWRIEKEEYKNSCDKMKLEGLNLLAKYFKELWV